MAGKKNYSNVEIIEGLGTFDEISVPGNPASGKIHVYAKTDGRMYRKNSAGQEVAMEGGSIPGALILEGMISPPVFTGNVINWNPTGIHTNTVVRIDPGADDREIQSVLAPSPEVGQLLIFINISTSGKSLTIINNHAPSTPANRFLLSANVTVVQSQSFTFFRDTTSLRWRPVAYIP